MVFHFRCFSFGNVLEDETSARANASDENYFTAFTDFNPIRSGSTPSSITWVVPSLSLRQRTPRLFTFTELKRATGNFSESSNIGEGGFGSVHLGVIKSLEHPFKDVRVAVKRSKRGSQGHKQLVTEVNVLGVVDHPNLVKLIGYCAEDDGNESHRLLVYEYMPNQSLGDCLSAKSYKPLSWATRLKIALDAASGLTYLHQHQIIVRDFKPSNILLDDRWDAKLSDFGVARLGPLEGSTHVSTAVVGTKGYGAPEYAQTGRLTYKSDVWSYGVFLEELITGARPLAHDIHNAHGHLGWVKCCYSVPQKSKLIVDPRLRGNYTEKSLQDLSFIAHKCLARDPKARPKMSEILQMVNNVIESEEKQLPNGGHT